MNPGDLCPLKSVVEQRAFLAHLIELHLRELFSDLRLVQHRLCFVESPKRELQNQSADNAKADNAERHTVSSRVGWRLYVEEDVCANDA